MKFGARCHESLAQLNFTSHTCAVFTCCVHAMPILQDEPDLYPEDLLSSDAVAERDWYVIYTLSRREKDLMRRLRSLKISHYGPMVERRTKSPSGRVRTSYVPLFAGYLFVCGSEKDRYETVSTGCISQCIPVSDAVELVRDLRQIRVLEEHGADLQQELRPRVGQLARIVRGPLADRHLMGTISEVNSQHRLTIMVNFLQQGASVVVDETDIELL